MLIAVQLCGCAATITPPAAPREPVDVYLLTHGYHTSLVLPDAGTDRFIRYGYGDWTYYAVGRKDVFSIFGALFLPTQAGLGRLEVIALGTDKEAALVVAVRVPIDGVHALQVDRAAAAALRARLESLYRKQRSQALLVNPWAHFAFVPHPQPYWIGANSNHAIAGWLREMGCEVRGPVLGAQWRVTRRGAGD